MNFFKKKTSKDVISPIKAIPEIETIVLQAVQSLFSDVYTQKQVFEFILDLKKNREGVSDTKTLLALLKYSDGDFELFQKSAWQSHPHFWMDEISHIFRTIEDAEKWVKSLSELQD